MDEAGTNKTEPVTVVVAVIAEADEAVPRVEGAVRELFTHVPEKFRENFVFHATDIYSGGKYGDDWSMPDRFRFLNTMMSLPRVMGLGLTVSAVWRHKENLTAIELPGKMTPAQADHITAFTLCIARSDYNIRQLCRPEEKAIVIAEDVTEVKRALHEHVERIKRDPIVLMPEVVRGPIRRGMPEDDQEGHETQIRIERVRNSVLFVPKQEDLLVQMADACAFGVRRYLAKKRNGEQFARAIFNEASLDTLFKPPATELGFWFGD